MQNKKEEARNERRKTAGRLEFKPEAYAECLMLGIQVGLIMRKRSLMIELVLLKGNDVRRGKRHQLGHRKLGRQAALGRRQQSAWVRVKQV